MPIHIQRRRGRPHISGKSAALLLALCLALAGILIPMAVRLPRWVEFELVLAGWWLVWAVTIAAILHRGCDVSDDQDPPGPRNWSGLDDIGSGCLDASCLIPDEGCGAALAALLIVPLLILGIWLVAELLIPAVAFAAYLAIRGMLAWAVNDRHHCAGNAPLSLFWGITYAALFTAPLAVLVFGIHQVLK